MQVGLNEKMDSLAKRLKFARKERDMTQAGLAEKSGIKQSDISKIENGSIQKTTALLALARALQCNADWLDTGAGEMLNSDMLLPSQPLNRLKIQSENEISINQYKSGGRMGNGGIALRDEQGVITQFTVTKQWLKVNVPTYSSVENLCIVTGYGDSMRPMYESGDPLLVDRGVKNVEFDGVYFFRVGQEGWIKRLQRIPRIGLRAISENKAYEPFDIGTDDDEFEVLGRVLIAWGRQSF